MDKALRDLQWQEYLTLLAGGCLSELGRDSLLAQMPLSDPHLARTRHELVREGLRATRHHGALPVKRFAGLGPLLTLLGTGRAGSAEQLRDAARAIELTSTLRAYLSEHEALLKETRQWLFTSRDLDALGHRLRAAIDDDARIRDEASEGLARARHRLTLQRRRIRDAQGALLRRFSGSLSGQFFAEHDGRFVLPVRTSAGDRVPGIVLGSSSSGGTLYVEPHELTEANNRVRTLEAEVATAEALVLSQLSEATAQHWEALNQAQRALVRADELQAVVRWALTSQAIPLEQHPERTISLVGARHPLLLEGRTPTVATDVNVAAGQSLVISGPNAGGKTVAMKCLGLAALCLRAGLPFPCDDASRVGWFTEVFTDIGDDQSMTRSLSTFSAHITNIAAGLTRAQTGQLVLLDELAGGTDPEEGAALAAAILGAFVERDAAVVVTTHYDKLKQLSATSPGSFKNASVGFDMTRLAPTFELTLGVPGASSAFAVASHFGIPPEVIAHAKEYMPPDQVSAQELLAGLEQERERTRAARKAAEDALDEIQLETQKQRRELERERERARAELKDKAAALTQELRQARAELQRAKTLWLDETADRQTLKTAESLLSAAAGPIGLGGSLTAATRPPNSAPAPDPTTLQPGTVVEVLSLNTRGEVVSVKRDGKVVVSMGGLKTTVDSASLRSVAPPKPPQRPARKRMRPDAGDGFTPSRTLANTCDLRGQRVESGLHEVELFVDRMLSQGEHAAYVLHGHGTGALKGAVRAYLQESPWVTHQEEAASEDGGDALTLFWLRD